MGALVIENGEIGPAVVTGVQGRGYDKKVAGNARWHLGSCTKSMTATLAAVMVRDGDLRWDSTVGEAFVDETFAVHDDYAAMTLVELLSHQAGVPNDLTERPMWGRLWIEKDGTETGQRQKIAADYLPRGPVHPPKSKFLYSNAGYVIAGRMLEKRGGKSFEQLLVERVFAPLSMTTAGFGPPTGDDDPRGHRNGLPMLTFRFADNPPGLSSAGRVHMTLADWAKYAAEHLRAARGEEAKLLTPEAAKFLHTPVGESNYALGWGRPTVDWSDTPVVAHAGSNTMWRAEIWICAAGELRRIGDGERRNRCRERSRSRNSRSAGG